ncbi:MAG: energy transducer TonB [Bacteroidaceae bacterium]|nr:energy transducer TonB [Bacteroidaceae bacterium]
MSIKRIFFLLLAALMVVATANSASFLPEIQKKKKDKIEMPKFPTGQRGLKKYLLEEAQFPPEARRNGVVGEVIVGFTVEANGVITGVRVLRSVSKELDAEAVRVVKNMPDWKPGKKNGKKVRTELTIPINFKVIMDNDRTNSDSNIQQFWNENVFR